MSDSLRASTIRQRLLNASDGDLLDPERLLEVARGPSMPSLSEWSLNYICGMDTPHEVDEDSVEYETWAQTEADCMAAFLARAVESYVASMMDPPPERKDY